MTLAHGTFLELTKFGGRKPSPESVGWKAFAWASFKFKHIGGRTLRPLPVTWRKMSRVSTRLLNGLGSGKKTPRDSHCFLRNPRAFKRMDILRFTPKNWIVNWVKITEMSEIKWNITEMLRRTFVVVCWLKWWGFFWEVQGIDLGDFWGLKSHDGHVIGDGHQPNSGGCRYACYKNFLIKVGWQCPI